MGSVGGDGGNPFDWGGNFSGNSSLGFFTGSGQNSGMLGLGQFRTDMYQPDPAAFAPGADERQLMQHMQSRAYGQAPSAAEMQMQQGLQQATAQSNALAASQRGISPALAARYAAMNQASMGQRANADSGIIRAQEQAGAERQLMGGYQNIRAGQMGLEHLRSGNYNFAQGLNERGYESAAQQRAGFSQGLMNMGGSMMAMGAYGGEVEDLGNTGVNPAAFNTTPNLPNTPIAESPYGKKEEKGGGGGGGIMKMLPMLAMLNEGGEVPAKGQSSYVAQYLNQRKIPIQKMASGGFPNPVFGGAVPMQNLPQPHQVMGLPAGVSPKLGHQMPNAMGAPTMMAGRAPQAQMGVPIQAPQTSPQMPMPWNNMRGMFGGPGNQMHYKAGGEIPGSAPMAGDSLKNDKIPALLSPKEIVLPRSVTLANDAPQRAKEFVARIKAKNKKSGELKD